MAKSKSSKSKPPKSPAVAGNVGRDKPDKDKVEKDQAEKKKKVSDGGKKAAAKKAAARSGEKEQSFIQKTRQFFREVKIELKKVTWPSRKETLASTSVVLVLVVLVAIYLGAVDILLSRALKLIVH
jgi:preprotein translocase subunit SecE